MPFSLESIEQLQNFFWILVRVSVLFFLLPLFGARNVPSLLKAGISLVIAVILAPVVPFPSALPQTAAGVAVGVASEAVMGVILVTVINMIFATVQMAGQFMSFQMGFSMARAIDPQTGAQSTVITQFLYLFTILLFFSINGHHIFLKALATSFYVVPPNSITFNTVISAEIVKISAGMFMVGVRIAAPIMVALFLSNLCLGIVARTVPQMNILMVGFPINLSIGLVLFSFLLLNFYPLITNLAARMGESLSRLIQLMQV